MVCFLSMGHRSRSVNEGNKAIQHLDGLACFMPCRVHRVENEVGCCRCALLEHAALRSAHGECASMASLAGDSEQRDAGLDGISLFLFVLR
jgi:hypothetical protein